MTDIKLLPLPLKQALDLHIPSGVRFYGHSNESMQHYARANVAHATAAKDAEIEALRAEVAWQKRVKSAHAELHREAKEHAERLAEALRDALECGNDGDWQSARQYITAALRDHFVEST